MPARVSQPIVLTSSPSTVIQACSVPDDNAKGRPEAKPSTSAAAIRGFVNSARWRLLFPGSGEREVIVDRQRRMVAEARLLENRRRARGCGDTRSGDLIVDAPPDVVGPRLTAVRPPCV